MTEGDEDFLNAFRDLDNDSDFIEELKNVTESTQIENELANFLEENKLIEHIGVFQDQQIDFETLMILTEADLKSLGLPLGPFRKLIVAIEEKKIELKAVQNGEHEDHDDRDHDHDISREGSEMSQITIEGNFRIIDESGDDSDAHSVKSDLGVVVKTEEDSRSFKPDEFHPYAYDLIHFELPDEFKGKTELETPVDVSIKNHELIKNEESLKNAIKSLRKEKVIAVDYKYSEGYNKTLKYMQISSEKMDYLIDFSVPTLDGLLLLFTDIFINPYILKVFYDAKQQVKLLQKYYHLFAVNVYCVLTAVKELKYETTSLYGLINKYVRYFQTTKAEISKKNLKPYVRLNLRKETHYLLHIYYKTRNEAIDAGIFDKLVENGLKICGQLHEITKRAPKNLFDDYKKFNDAQKWAAEEMNSWRENLAKEKNTNPDLIMNLTDMKTLCLSLPNVSEKLLHVSNTKITQDNCKTLMAIMKAARKKYFRDPKDLTKYELNNIDMPVKKKPKKKPVPKPSPNPNQTTPAAKQEAKRKNEELPLTSSSAKKQKHEPKNDASSSKGKSAEANKPNINRPKASPFKKPANNNHGGYQAFQPTQNVLPNVLNLNFGRNSPPVHENLIISNFPNPQDVWQSQYVPSNRNFTNFNENYWDSTGGFKYY